METLEAGEPFRLCGLRPSLRSLRSWSEDAACRCHAQQAHRMACHLLHGASQSQPLASLGETKVGPVPATASFKLLAPRGPTVGASGASWDPFPRVASPPVWLRSILESWQLLCHAEIRVHGARMRTHNTLRIWPCPHLPDWRSEVQTLGCGTIIPRGKARPSMGDRKTLLQV